MTKLIQINLFVAVALLTGCTTCDIPPIAPPQKASPPASSNKNWQESDICKQIAGTWKRADANYIPIPDNQEEFFIGKPSTDGHALFAFIDRSRKYPQNIRQQQGETVMIHESPELQQLTARFHPDPYEDNQYIERTLTLSGSGTKLAMKAVVLNIPLIQYWTKPNPTKETSQ